MYDYDPYQENNDDQRHIANLFLVRDMQYDSCDRQGGLDQALGPDQCYDDSCLGQPNDSLKNPPDINYRDILGLSSSPPSLGGRIDHWLEPAAQRLVTGGAMNQGAYDSVGGRMPGGGFMLTVLEAAPSIGHTDTLLTENVKELLNGEGGVPNGQTVLVTGTLPKLGRKNLVRLIESYGGELLRGLRKTTSLVGRSFLVRAMWEIARSNLKTVDEDGFINILEEGRGIKRGAVLEEADDIEKEEHSVKVTKKQKKYATS
ncbi:hypothetical protein BDZ45DRAFT_751248 [Acephala macrosclerotiorum]|nr:hypothetical protein BDZ45DRAFT_751248 [Acephala macrosclerotiorum]